VEITLVKRRGDGDDDRAYLTVDGQTRRGPIHVVQLAGRGREAARGQPGIGQPVAEQNLGRIRLTHHLDRDHTAIGSTQLHPTSSPRDIDP
jgi:hypothetical protein